MNKNQHDFLMSGAYWAIYTSLNSFFLIAFAIALGASNTIIGVLGALPYVAIVLAEAPGVKLTEYFSRKLLYVWLSGISRLMWIPLMFLPYFLVKSPIAFIILFYFLSVFFDYLPDPAWTSMVADIVPEKTRGAYFGMKFKLQGLLSVVFSTIAGFYLNIFPKGNYFGFSSLFFIGIVLGIVGVIYFNRIKEPEKRHVHHHIREFVVGTNDFYHFCLYSMLFNFGIMFASPFFQVFMLENLKMSYSIFALANNATILVKILSYSFVGKLADRFGDKPIAIISYSGTAILPLLCLFITPANIWLMFVAQALAGLAWAGADITIFNFLLGLTEDRYRAAQTATYNIINSSVMIIAPVLGGIVADWNKWQISGIMLVFVIATVLRLASGILFMKVKEPRAKHEASVTKLFVAALAHPANGMMHRVYIAIKQFKKR